MDYKYIEQLLERYWQCETTLEEEAILRTFFSQTEIPQQLRPYKNLFVIEKALQEARLDDGFDAKVLSRVQEAGTVKAHKITLTARLKPLYKAAASVAIILTLGNAAQTSFHGEGAGCDYNYENYQDSYNDPAMAYDQVSDALQMVSQSLSEAMKEDSLLQAHAADNQNEPE